MESVLGRYKNLIVLVVVLFAQVLGLAVQVKRTSDTESSRLIRIWTVNSVTPFEKILAWIHSGTGGLWHNYFYLRGVRAENRELKQQIEQLRLEQVRLKEDAAQARRLQALLGFKEQFIAQTTAAQVIGTGGSEQSRIIYIDKGEHDGIKQDMAVMTVDGIVGKVLKVYRSSAQVLLINDQSSGVGALLEKSRLQGIVRGSPAGEVMLEKIMTGEGVQVGETVRTSGGDRIFPKGLPVGVVAGVANGADLFLNIRVRPAANLSKLEEVLVVTRLEEKEPTPAETGPVRAADILAERLPSVPDKPAGDPNKPKEGGSAAPAVPATKPLNPNATMNPAPTAGGKAATANAAANPVPTVGGKPRAKPQPVSSGSIEAVPAVPAKAGTKAPPTGLKPATQPGITPPDVKVANPLRTGKPANSQTKPATPQPETPQPATAPPNTPQDGPQ